MLRDKCESCVKASQTLDGPVQEAQSLVAEIFRPDLTMKLALASVLLGTAALDEACRAVIKKVLNFLLRLYQGSNKALLRL